MKADGNRRGHVGGVGYQCAGRRISGAPNPVRQAVLSAGIRFGDEIALDAGCFRILRQPAAVLKKSGVDYMMTQKLSWSEYNRHPHHSFLWEGIDGSAVLTHMPPEDTYNSPAPAFHRQSGAGIFR